MQIVLGIISCIVLISLVLAMIAFLVECFAKDRNNHKPYGPYERFIKRPTDVFFATGALFVFSPIMLITALLVFAKLGAPVVFVQERPGKNQKIFHLYKFRSMTNEKGKDGKLLPDKDRIGKFGKLLRSSSLDELPELINIIKGDMSIIGPRPLLVKYLKYYNEHDQRRHEVRPGLTGLAQCNGRNLLSWREKFQKDVDYVDHLSFIMDVKIFLQTIHKVINKNGIEFMEGHQSITEYFDQQGK